MSRMDTPSLDIDHDSDMNADFELDPLLSCRPNTCSVLVGMKTARDRQIAAREQSLDGQCRPRLYIITTVPETNFI